VFCFQAEDGIRDRNVTGVQTCALPISLFQSPEPDAVFSAIALRLCTHFVSLFAAQSPTLCAHREVGAHLYDFPALSKSFHPKGQIGRASCRERACWWRVDADDNSVRGR